MDRSWRTTAHWPDGIVSRDTHRSEEEARAVAKRLMKEGNAFGKPTGVDVDKLNEGSEEPELELYIRSMRKIFKIVHVTTSVKDANQYMEKHADCGVIAERNGVIYIASNTEIMEVNPLIN